MLVEISRAITGLYIVSIILLIWRMRPDIDPSGLSGKRVNVEGTSLEVPLDMIHYPGTEKENAFSVPFVSFRDSGEVLISISGSFHIGGGGHFFISFNMTEFLERLF